METWERKDMKDDEFIKLINGLSEKECLQKTMISLYGNKYLTKIPSEIKRFKNLKTLWLHGNSITHTGVCEELSELKLETLFFSSVLTGNPLKQIPNIVFNLIHLRKLSLGYCHLTFVPPDIGNLINLVGLRLNGNEISTLPSEMIKLKKLTYLSLQDNRLPEHLMLCVLDFDTTQSLLRKI